MDCSLPGSSIHGIFQARILEWVAISSSTGSSWPRDPSHVSYISCIAGSFFTTAPPGKSIAGIQPNENVGSEEVKVWKGACSRDGEAKPWNFRESEVRHVQPVVWAQEEAMGSYSLCITSSLWIHSQASSEQLRAGIRHQGQTSERPEGQGALTHSSSPYVTSVTLRGLAAVLVLLSISYTSSLRTTLAWIGKKGTIQHITLPNLFKEMIYMHPRSL